MKNIKVYTSFVSPVTFKIFCDNNILPIFIIRNIKNSNLIGKFDGSAIHFKTLAPSNELFRKRRDGIIDFVDFSKEYAIEMSQVNFSEVIREIEYLAELSNTDRVVLLGYGSDYTNCHRSILSGILNDTGLLQEKVTEIVL